MQERYGVEQIYMNRPESCELCGDKLHYEGLGRYSCNSCGKIHLDDYGKVRNYIETHKGASLREIECDTGVSRHVIHLFRKDGMFAG